MNDIDKWLNSFNRPETPASVRSPASVVGYVVFGDRIVITVSYFDAEKK